MKKLYFSCALLIILSGCGDFEHCYQTIDGSFECETIEPEPMPTPSPSPETPTERVSCPDVEFFGRDENVWKPKGENQPTLVVLLSGKYKEPFECQAELKRGGAETLRYTGFANAGGRYGLRQHHRGNEPGGKYKGEIKCKVGGTQCTFRHTGRTGNRSG